MYSSITGFELDMEHKSLPKRNSQMFSTVNCLTVDFWGTEVCADSLLPASFLRTCANSFLGKKSIETEDELKKAPTHSHDIENLFGIEGSIIIRFGPQVFKKLFFDLVTNYNDDLCQILKSGAPGKQEKLRKCLRNSRKSLIQNSQL